MGACLSQDAESGIKKFNQKKSKNKSKIPDGTQGEDTKDLYSYQREEPSCSKTVNGSSPSRSSQGRTFYDGPSRPLRKYDRVIWIDEDNLPEKGTFRWIGTLEGERCAGLELDKKRTVSFGNHTGRKLFSCRPGHRAVVPLYQVMLVKDYEERLQTAATLKPRPSKVQVSQPSSSSSNKPKRKMKESVDRFYSGRGQKDSVRKTKVEKETSASQSQQQSSSFQSNTNTLDSYKESSAMAASTPKTTTATCTCTSTAMSDATVLEPPVPRKRMALPSKDPNWSPGDKIKFRRSKDEAEILETKLEDDGLMAKIQYTEDSARPGEVEISPLVDIMMESSLVKPPILHQTLRRNSFLEAVTPTPVPVSQTGTSSGTGTGTLRKDEAIQTSLTALDEIMSPPSFRPDPPNGKLQSTSTKVAAAAQTSFEYPSTSTSTRATPKYTFINPRPSSLYAKSSRQKTPPPDVVDFVKPWPGSSTSEKDEFTYPGRWTESFRKSQREAARVGALKMRELKAKLEKSTSSDELGGGDGYSSSRNTPSEDTKLELERAHVQSPLMLLDDLHQRPLESPTLVKLARRNTYPLIRSSLASSASAHAHPYPLPFTKERIQFFDVNMNTQTQPEVEPERPEEAAKIVGVEMKAKPTPTYAQVVVAKASYKIKHKSYGRRPISEPPAVPVQFQDLGAGSYVNKNGDYERFDHGVEQQNIDVSVEHVEVELQHEESSKRGRDSAFTVDSLSRPSSKKRRKLCRPGLQKNALEIYPPFTSDDIQYGLGSQRGIGGIRNSCYLDATLFALFYCTDIFDTTILFNNSDDDLARLTTKYLHNIVVHLRGGGFCEGERVMKLRRAMRSDKVKGHFMDVEEFMFNLFEQTLKLPEFIHYYPDTKDYLTQIFIDNNDARKYATVQELLEASFKLQDDLKLVSIPFPAWIIEMPRSNGRLVHYDAIIPTVHLKMNDLMMKVLNDGTVSVSCFCQIGKPPFWACQICHDEVDRLNQKLTFCSSCKDSLITSLHDEMNHSPEPVLYEPATNSLVEHEAVDSVDASASTELTMDLLAVICFKACHYTCFVKCGSGKDTTWIYFDSMTGTSSVVEEVTEMNFWLNQLEKDPKIYKNKNVPGRVKQLLFDSHIYIYAATPSACPKSTAVAIRNFVEVIWINLVQESCHAVSINMHHLQVGDRIHCSTKYGRRARRQVVYGTILYFTTSHLAHDGPVACVEFDFCHICNWTEWWSHRGRFCKMYHQEFIPVTNLKKLVLVAVVAGAEEANPDDDNNDDEESMTNQFQRSSEVGNGSRTS